MTVKQRLIMFAKSKERSVRAFELRCGLTIGYINAIRVSISPDKIQSIVSNYPELNTDWLLTGRGQMKNEVENRLNENKSEYQITEKTKSDLSSNEALLSTIKNLSDTVNRQSKKIEELENELKEIKKATLVNKDDVKGAAAS